MVDKPIKLINQYFKEPDVITTYEYHKDLSTFFESIPKTILVKRLSDQIRVFLPLISMTVSFYSLSFIMVSNPEFETVSNTDFLKISAFKSGINASIF
jgi:hypothetical protein